MSGFNLPPGCGVHDIPGNEKHAQRYRRERRTRSDAPKRVSPEMQRAIDRARHNGGKLKRLPGGFWVGIWDDTTADSISAVTVNALVSRGLAQFTRDQQRGHGCRGSFPVEITLTEAIK